MVDNLAPIKNIRIFAVNKILRKANIVIPIVWVTNWAKIQHGNNLPITKIKIKSI